MSDTQSQRVSIELKKGYQFLVRFEDVKGKPTLLCDEPPPLGDGEGPNPAAILGAAVGNCLAASFAFCLRRARLEPASLTASVTTHIARNERGRFRISSIDVELAPELAGGAAGQKRCQELFEDFCIVTASIRQGIPVSVSLNSSVRSAA